MAALRSLEIEHIAMDEAGRGAIAGPLAVCAVVLKPGAVIPGLRESKQLRPDQISAVCAEVLGHVEAYNIGTASPDEINRYGIEEAQRLAYGRAIGGLVLARAIRDIVIDGKIDYLEHDPTVNRGGFRVTTEVAGDARFASLAVASVIAKCWVDEQMRLAAQDYPWFDWGTNCGYWNVHHAAMLNVYGPSPLHRRAFGPVATAVLPQLPLWQEAGTSPTLEQMQQMDEAIGACVAATEATHATPQQLNLWPPAIQNTLPWRDNGSDE